MSDDSYKIQAPSAAKQFGIAVFFGALAASIAYKIADSMAEPDKVVGYYQTRGAYKFVFYVTAFAGGVAFIIALKVYKWWADRQYAKSLGPPAAKAIDRS